MENSGWINPIEDSFDERENSIRFSIPSQLAQIEALPEANFSGESNEIILRPIFFKGIKDEGKTGLLTRDYKLMYVEAEGTQKEIQGIRGRHGNVEQNFSAQCI